MNKGVSVLSEQTGVGRELCSTGLLQAFPVLVYVVMWAGSFQECALQAEGTAHLELQSGVVLDDDFGEDAGPQGGLVFLKKGFVYILVEERGLSHTEEKKYSTYV